jgi:preprotein translocase subunit SecY
MSSIPLKLNIAGVIPVIFASTLLSMPLMIMQFLGKQAAWTHYFSQSFWFNSDNWKFTIGYLVYAALVIFFAYFYTFTSFNPIEVASNLRKSGSVIPGIRPGKSTSDYLTKIIVPVIFIGAVWMLFIVTIPMIFNGQFNASVSFGGTSIVIVVGVIVETMSQIRSMQTTYQTRGFLK